MSAVGPGAAAPRFRLPRLGGGTIDLDEFLAAGPVWIFFMKSTCGTCRIGAPFVERFHERCAGSAAQVLVVMEDSEADARAFADEYGWTLPVAVESAPWPVSEAYGLYAVPSNFVIAQSGRVMRVGVGFYRTEWNDYARDLLANGPVSQGLDGALVAVPGAGVGTALPGSSSQEGDLIAAAAELPEFKPG